MKKLALITLSGNGLTRCNFVDKNLSQVINNFASTQQILTFTDVEVIICYDDNDKSDIDTILNGKELNFIALHYSKYANNFHEYKWPNCLPYLFHHESDPTNFYKYILPKVADGSLTLNDLTKPIEGKTTAFFPEKLDVSLTLLNEIYGENPLASITTKFQTLFEETEYKELYETFKTKLEDKFDHTIEAHYKALADFRDDILRLTLANQSS
ncbi:MAG: hypothetical protein KA536_11555 [Saprospiraceae bacterium]|nr:hypothetical protein [Saprospiraceae bacterium]